MKFRVRETASSATPVPIQDSSHRERIVRNLAIHQRQHFGQITKTRFAPPPKLSRPWHGTVTASRQRGSERNARKPTIRNYVLSGLGIRHANGSRTSAVSDYEVLRRVLSAAVGRALADQAGTNPRLNPGRFPAAMRALLL